MTDDKASRVLQRHRKLKSEKEPWLTTYQLIGEYVMTRKQDFTNTVTPGEFLTGRIFDNTAGNANHLMASSLIGALWPNGAKTFQINPPGRMHKEWAQSEEIRQYYEDITRIMVEAIDHPKAGFLTSLEEYMLDQGAFGISGIGVFENDDDLEMPVRFIAVDAKKIAIDEGSDGFVDTVYVEKQYTVRQLIQEYGIDNASEKVRKAFLDGRVEDKVTVLHAIESRIADVPGTFGVADKPIASIHIEVQQKHILRESGFHEMPIFVTRFWKAMNEKYGRSPAMEAMSDILEANALREASIVATEKMLDPPLIMIDDGSMGGGVIDTSAGAVNIRRISGRMGDINHKPVEQLITVGEMDSTFKRIGELREIIFNAFFIDRLLDLNNEQRMTLGEANIRNELRGQSLGTIYARQISELFTRLIERVFNILLGKGLIGVPPGSNEEQQILLAGGTPLVIPAPVLDLMLDGRDAYKITFISPAARIMRSEELLGIQRTVEFTVNAAQVAPDVLDVLDMDTIVRDIQDLTGAPAHILKSGDTVSQIREARAQQQQAMAQMQAQQVASETARNMGQAMQAQAKAQA